MCYDAWLLVFVLRAHNTDAHRAPVGYNWEFCGCGGAGGVQQGNPPKKGEMDCGGYPRPESLNRDYGTPKGICQETKPGIFVREWVRERANRMRIRFPFCQPCSTRVSTLWSFLLAISKSFYRCVQTKATVTMDCNTGAPSIKMLHDE